jgi:ferredoxin hydrogenase large subunit
LCYVKHIIIPGNTNSEEVGSLEKIRKTFQEGEVQGVITIDKTRCKGCDTCKRHCPTKAITGMFGSVHSIDTEKCINCGQCLVNCPFNAPYEKVDAVDKVMENLKNENITVVGIIAPAVRVAIGEEFGLPPGELATGRMYGAMQKAGFKIFDNNYAADLTIMEEGTEFIHRVRSAVFSEEIPGHKAGPLPQFTSCCPAWVRYVEINYPSLIPNLSSAKSPQQMAGSVAKTYGAMKVWNKKPETVYTVGIMPCTAKKFEASRPEFKSAFNHLKKETAAISGAPYPDIDAVLTTRDLARLFKNMGINLAKEKDAAGDSILAEYSGAGTIFGNTGGVMEAAVRTVHAVLTGKELEPVEFKPVRGLKGVKSTSVTLTDTKYNKSATVNVAVVHGLRENIAPVLEEILAGRSSYHFIEVMNCPGGCINGGGQPIHAEGTGWLGAMSPLFAWK